MEEMPPKVPHSREAEEAIVSSILINPDVYYEVIDTLRPEDFYIHRLRWAMEAFGRLVEKKIPIDVLNLGREMNSQYDEFGGGAYATSLINAYPTSINATSRAKAIKADSIRRKLLTAANKVATLVYDEHIETEELAGSSAQAIENAIKTATNGTIESVKDVASRVYDLTDKNSKKTEEEKNLGLRTGYIDIDNLLRGVGDTNLVYVGGRPGMGKSGFLQNLIRHVSIEGVNGVKKNAALFSMEASNEESARRLLSQLSTINSQDIKEGTLADDEWPKYVHAVGQISDAKIFLDDTPALSPMQLKAKCKRLKMVHGLGLIVVDYLQLMQIHGSSQNRHQEVGKISRSLKELTQELRVPVFAAVQLNRNLEDRKNKRPLLSDMKESGDLEQDANIVMFLYRDDYYHDDSPDVGLVEVIVAKHRDGPVGTVNLVVRPACTRFENAVTRNVSFVSSDPALLRSV